MEKGGTFNVKSGGFSLMKEHDISSNISEKKNYYMMGMSHHQEKRTDLERPFVGGGGTTVSGGGVGPISCSNSGANEVLGNIYRDDVPFSSSPFLANSTTTSPKFEANKTTTSVSTNLQPFHHSGYCSTPFKSPGGMSTDGGGFPFTPAQWEELERQALIYKCMMSSVPVPPHLLFPFSGNFTAPPASIFCTNTRYSKNGDPEPGRCKRTDGKKWRCSRDVAPHQKYCERHLHRGRPRSRKPVEASLKNTSVVGGGGGENHKKTRLEQTTTSSAVVSQQQFVQTTVEQPPFMLFNANNTDLSMSGGPSYKGINRDLSLIVENEMVAMDWAEQQWKNLMVTKMAIANEGSSSYSSYGSSAGVASYHQDYGNFFPYSAFPPLEIGAPTGFIDAWSMDNLNKVNPESSLSPNNGNLSPSLNLSMAMAAGNVMDGEMSKIQEENGTKDFIDDKTNELQWLSPVSWEPFSLGGPLAEALHPGSIPASPYDSMNSNQATNVSSPSGVLHRNMFSNSDGSVCNSPTFAAPPSEIAFQWLN